MKQKIKSSCESAVIFILLGIFTLVFADKLAKSICVIIGVFALIYAVVKITNGIRIKNALETFTGLDWQFDLTSGIIAAIIGLVLVGNPAWVLSLLHLAIGVLVIADSIFKIKTSLAAKKLGLENWWVSFAFAMFICLIGVFLIIDPIDSIVMTVIGIALIITGIQNLMEAMTANQISKRRKNDSPDLIETSGEDVNEN